MSEDGFAELIVEIMMPKKEEARQPHKKESSRTSDVFSFKGHSRMLFLVADLKTLHGIENMMPGAS